MQAWAESQPQDFLLQTISQFTIKKRNAKRKSGEDYSFWWYAVSVLEDELNNNSRFWSLGQDEGPPRAPPRDQPPNRQVRVVRREEKHLPPEKKDSSNTDTSESLRSGSPSSCSSDEDKPVERNRGAKPNEQGKSARERKKTRADPKEKVDTKGKAKVKNHSN